MATNEFGQLIGPDIGEWESPPMPDGQDLVGRTVSMEALDPSRHGPSLWQALRQPPHSIWTYMSFGPFADYDSFQTTLESLLVYPDWVPYAILVNREPKGFASYLRVNPRDGVIEIGSITFAPSLQKTTPATESLYLMMSHVFELGYRRCEWKCDDLNAPSRSAALRLGFTYEGTFRQATHYKGRNRDTSWYAITDVEWKRLEPAFVRWLAADNFDENGHQNATLEEMRNG